MDINKLAIFPELQAISICRDYGDAYLEIMAARGLIENSRVASKPGFEWNTCLPIANSYNFEYLL